MKQVFTFLVVLILLAGCQMESTVEEEANSAPATTDQQDSEANTPLQMTDVAGESGNDAKIMVLSDQATLNRSLSDVLVQAIRDYGIMTDNAILFNDDDETGVLYAELLDLDADGQDELYVLSKIVADKIEWIQDDETIFDNFYTHDIWRAGADGATHVFSKQMIKPDNFCESCGYSIDFRKLTDETWQFEIGYAEFFEDEDGARFTTERYELVGDEMQHSTYVFETSGETEQYFINAESVEEEAYTVDYSDESIAIIQNTIGQMNFSFDGAEFKFDETDSSAAVVSNVLAQLNEGINTLPQTGTAVNAEQIDDWMEQLEYFQLVASYDKTIHPTMLHTLLSTRIYLLAESDIENDPIADEYGYLPFSEAIVLEYFERLYGVPFAGEDFSLLEPSYENSIYTTYKDGIFYVRVIEGGTLGTIHDIDAAYEISPNTYYIESTMRDFDWLGHQESLTYEQGFEDESRRMFREEPIDTWPFELRHFTHTSLKRYTVFQLNDEETELRYYHYVPLSDAELEKYK